MIGGRERQAEHGNGGRNAIGRHGEHLRARHAVSSTLREKTGFWAGSEKSLGTPGDSHHKDFLRSGRAVRRNEWSHCDELAPPLADLSGPVLCVQEQSFFDEEYPAHDMRYHWKSLHRRGRIDDAPGKRSALRPAGGAQADLRFGQLLSAHFERRAHAAGQR